MFVIKIANTKTHPSKGVYVARPSPLGNPFPLRKESDRDAVIASYRQWFEERIRQDDPVVVAAVTHIYQLARTQGEVTLSCFCSPRSCHAEVVAQAVAARLHSEGEECDIVYIE